MLLNSILIENSLSPMCIDFPHFSVYLLFPLLQDEKGKPPPPLFGDDDDDDDLDWLS